MLFMLDEIMTPREASDRWGVSINSLHMKLSRLFLTKYCKDCASFVDGF